MLKKYFPFFALAAVAILLWYVKTNQRGRVKMRPPQELPDDNRGEDLNRNASTINYSKHARCRMDCRHIDDAEVREILETGTINYSKVETDAMGKTYPLEGVTHDKQHVRIVFAPKDNGEVLVVTCIDLDKDWACDCK